MHELIMQRKMNSIMQKLRLDGAFAIFHDFFAACKQMQITNLKINLQNYCKTVKNARKNLRLCKFHRHDAAGI